MANISSTLDSIFDDGMGFDAMFDSEDRLIDTIEAVGEGDASIVNGDVGHIPGEPDTDNGKGGHEGTSKNSISTDTEGKEVPGSHEHNAYPDGLTAGGFKKELGYSEGADLDELFLDENATNESADLDDILLDENFDEDGALTESDDLDAQLYDEEYQAELEAASYDWFGDEILGEACESGDDDIDDDLIDSVDGEGGEDPNLDYEPGVDDALLDDMM